MTAKIINFLDLHSLERSEDFLVSFTEDFRKHGLKWIRRMHFKEH